jgi:hypothetical protein
MSVEADGTAVDGARSEVAPAVVRDALPRARRHLGLVLGLGVIELALAWWLTDPWAAAIDAIWGSHPDGDRSLFLRPGLLELAEVVTRHPQLWIDLSYHAIRGAAAWFLIAQPLLGGLLGGLSSRGRVRLRAFVSDALAHAGRLALVQVGVAVGCFAALFLVGFWPSMMIAGHEGSWRPMTQLALSIAPWLPALVTVAYLRAAGDLSRALVVRHDLGPFDAWIAALRAPRIVGRQLVSWAPRAFAAFGLIGLAFAYVGPRALGLAFVAHVAISLAQFGLRASVLARALATSDALAPTLATSDALAPTLATNNALAPTLATSDALARAAHEARSADA